MIRRRLENEAQSPDQVVDLLEVTCPFCAQSRELPFHSPVARVLTTIPASLALGLVRVFKLPVLPELYFVHPTKPPRTNLPVEIAQGNVVFLL